MQKFSLDTFQLLLHTRIVLFRFPLVFSCRLIFGSKMHFEYLKSSILLGYSIWVVSRGDAYPFFVIWKISNFTSINRRSDYSRSIVHDWWDEICVATEKNETNCIIEIESDFSPHSNQFSQKDIFV